MKGGVTRDMLIDALVEMVNQHCAEPVSGALTFHLNSFALSANSYAMRLLAKIGRLKITEDRGRCVIGEWVP